MEWGMEVGKGVRKEVEGRGYEEWGRGVGKGVRSKWGRE